MTKREVMAERNAIRGDVSPLFHKEPRSHSEEFLISSQQRSHHKTSIPHTQEFQARNIDIHFTAFQPQSSNTFNRYHKMPLIIPGLSENPTNSSSLPASTVPATSTTETASAVSQAAGADKGSSAAEGRPSGGKSEVEEAADKLYEERIEEEYAKREGGA